MSYKPDPNADIFGTSLVEEIEVAPAQLVHALGAPHRRADRYKVSGLYCFVEPTTTSGDISSDDIHVFTVYDWKATSLYNEELPSPLAFWNSKDRVRLSIGSNCDVWQFLNGGCLKRFTRMEIKQQ
uniref:Uncharacterized protein n=1 Tax=Geobacter sp. (strain M21) TaxID=443144 RepID=C6E7D8_GEOSM